LGMEDIDTSPKKHEAVLRPMAALKCKFLGLHLRDI
jgi:hypothetical protein